MKDTQNMMAKRWANRTKLWGIAGFLVLFAFLFSYPSDLVQNNKEYLFLDSSHLRQAQTFQEQFHEKGVLITKLEFPLRLGGVRDEDLAVVSRQMALLEERFGEDSAYQLQWMSFESTLGQFFQGPKAPARLAFLQKLERGKNPPLIHWQGKDFVAFLTLTPAQLSSAQVATYLQAVRQTPWGATTVKLSGLPYLNHQLDLASEQIKTRLFPMLFLVTFLLVLAFTRHFPSALLIFFPALGAVGLSLSLIKLFYGSMNMITSMVSPLLFIINFSLSFNLYSSYRELGSWELVLKEKTRPMLMMVAAATIGLGSCGVSPFPVIRQLALTGALGVLAAAALCVLWHALLLPGLVIESREFPFEKFLKKFLARSLSLRSILVLSALIVLLAPLQFSRIRKITDAGAYFPEHGPVASQMKELEREVVGLPLAEILLQKKGRGPVTYDDLQAFNAMELRLEEALGPLRVFSANVLVRQINSLYSGNDSLPPQFLSYHALLGRVPPAMGDSYPLQEQYRMTLMGPSPSDDSYSQMMRKVEETLADPAFSAQYSFSWNGIYYHLLFSQLSLMGGLAFSFLLGLVLINAMAWPYFRKAGICLAFFWVSILPILLKVIFFRAMDLSFNVGTVMTFSISIGIIGSGTFHMAHSLLGNEDHARHFHRAVLPVFISGLLLSLPFALFGLHDSLPIREVGISLSFTILVGTLFDLFIFPTLLRTFNRKPLPNVD